MGARASLNQFARSLTERTLSAGFALVVALFFAAAVMAVTEIILHYRVAEVESGRKSAAMAFASELRARVDRELNSVLYLGSGIVGYLVVRHEQIDPQEVIALLGAVYSQGRHLRNLGVAVGYRLSYLYPESGNEPAIGRDYRDLPGQWPAVDLAIKTRKAVITGPVRLVQGGEGLVFRVPIFVNDTYWGMLSTVIDIPSFQQAAFGGQLNGRYAFAVKIEESTGSGGMLWGADALFADPASIVIEAQTPNGKWVYAVRDQDGNGVLLVWGIRSLSGMVALAIGFCVLTVLRQRRALSRLAGFDPLTGLPNRRLFDDRLDQAVRRLARKGETGQIATIFIDLDGFKQINDRHGHKAGDAVLRIVANRVREAIRPGDTVSRWAGDEFVVVVEEAGQSRIDELVDRLRQRIESPMEVEGTGLSVMASIGAARYPEEAASRETLLELADQRMYQDKALRQAGGAWKNEEKELG